MSQLICLFCQDSMNVSAIWLLWRCYFAVIFQKSMNVSANLLTFRFSTNVSSNFLVFIADITKRMLTIPSILCIFPL